MYSIEDAIEQIQAADIPTPIKSPLPTNELVANYEAKLGVIFPPDYKKVLKEISNAFVGTLTLIKLRPSMETEYGELCDAIQRCTELGIPAGWLPICEDNANFYLLTPHGTVQFWDHNGTNNEDWQTLAIWIRDVWLLEG